MGVHAGGNGEWEMFWISPLDCEISLWGGPRPGCRVASQALCSLQGTFTLSTSLVCSLMWEALLAPLMDEKAEVSMGGGHAPQATRR